MRLSLEGLEERLTPSVITPINNDAPAAFGQVNPNAAPATTTTASPATAPFSTSAQTVTLNATVTSNGTAVTEGTVTFTVLQGTNVIGTATPGPVNSSGQASATYTLPGGTDAGTYTIDASYTDSTGNFAASSDTTQKLTVTSSTAAATTTTASSATATFSPTAQNVTLNATVTSNGTPVTKGSVTFSILQGSTVIGMATPGTVNSSGQATASYALPAGTAAGSYTIEADYSDNTGTFAASSDTTQKKLTVSAAATTTAASNATATFSTSAQSVTLNATVTSSAGTVSEGSVQFTLLDSSGNTIGTATSGTVSNSGQASVSYALPAGTLAGSYTIDASYTDTAGNFAASSDKTHTLAVSGASTTTTASNATTAFNGTAQNVTLQATVSSSAGPVNEGTVTFTILNSQGNTIGTATTSGTVSNGTASVSYVLPAGTATGSYTIDAVYNPGPDFSGSSDNTHTLTVNAAASTSVSLATVSIVPNLANGTAQVTLTANVSNAAGTVGEGVVNFTMAGVSAKGNLVNGMTMVTLTVPIQNVIDNPSVSLAYTDTATPASFANGSNSRKLYLNAWNGVLPSSLSFAADGSELIEIQVGGQPFLGFAYSAVGLPIQINVGSVTLPVTYSNTASNVLVTIAGLPWQLNFFNAAGQFQGLISLAFASDGSPEWLIYNSSGQIVGAMPV